MSSYCLYEKSFRIQDVLSRAYLSSRPVFWAWRAVKPNWFYAGEGCTMTSVETFLTVPVAEFFLLGLLILTPNGVAYQPLNVLSKCLIWNRETIYFKKKGILCSNCNLSHFNSEQSSKCRCVRCICVIFVYISVSDIEWWKRALGKRPALATISDRNR